MKDFLKFTLASLIGVILAGIVLTILGLITVVGMVASSDSETIVKDNSVFVLDLKGNLSERVQENPFQQIMGDGNGSYGLNDILSSIKKAKENDKIKGISNHLIWPLLLHHWKKYATHFKTSRKAVNLS